MPKQSTPLLSFQASGTVGGAVTYQGKGQRKISRTKPMLPYFLTLPVQYQRWLYEDYAYLWRQQSASTRRQYHIDGRPHHLTGYQYWMKDMLTRLPDIAGMWHLDRNAAGVARDFSRNENHGTIIGASQADGIIDGAQSFDGLNDYVNCGNDATLQITTEITVETFAYFNAHHPTSYSSLISKTNTLAAPVFARGYCFEYYNTREFYWILGSAIARGLCLAGNLELQTLYHLGGTWDGTTMRVYVDGIEKNNIPFVGPIFTERDLLFSNLFLGSTHWLNGWLDHTVLYNRCNDPSEMLRHSLRRWPH